MVSSITIGTNPVNKIVKSNCVIKGLMEIKLVTMEDTVQLPYYPKMSIIKCI